jgi:elongation factor P
MERAAEGAAAAFHTVVLLAGCAPLAARARESQPPVVHVNLDVVPGQAGKLRDDDVVIGCLMEIDGRVPALGPGSEPVQALLDGKQITERIPARERHVVDDISPTSYRLPADMIGRFYIPMATIQATRVKKGMLVKMGEDLFRILDFQHVTPGNLRGFVRVKLRNIRNGALADQKLRSEDMIERATLDEREMQYLYKDGDDYYFMDTTSYEQVHISSEALGDSVSYLKAEMTILVEFYGTEPVGIELPQTVDLKVMDTVPGIKGATASNQVKPATLETGLVVQVPPFINTGDVVRVSTDSGEYLSRA